MLFAYRTGRGLFIQNKEQMDLIKYISYFNAMKIGDRIQVSSFKDPVKLVKAGKLCIDLGYDILFSDDYSEIIKVKKFDMPPESGAIFLK